MFRLKSLSIKRHKVLKDITIDFNQNATTSAEFLLSIIIGKNGIGKSHILKAICEIFIFLYKVSKGLTDITEPSFDFAISYEIDSKQIEISRDAIRQGRILSSDDLPTRVIATSTFVMDKYPTQSNPMYRYCGIRNEYNSGSTSTKGLVRKTVYWVLKSLAQKIGFADEIKNLLEELGLSHRLTLSYSVRYKNIFLQGNLTTQKLKEIYSDQKSYFTNRKDLIWGTDGFKAIADNEEMLEEVVCFLNGLVDRRRRYDNIEFHNKIDIHLLAPWDPAEIARVANALELCGKIGILSYPTLTVHKSLNSYDFAESSSGETTLLCQLLSIMSNIEPNSLILIDEPEQSCHPNWQINYVTWLRRIFSKYPSCHFVVSTHSHFLLTDLNPENSSLSVLDFSPNGNIIVQDWTQMPYGWSSDDILYRVFHVRNTRNYVFESKMMKLYELIQNNHENKDKIMSLIKELKEYKLNDDDPLLKLISFAQEHA